MTTAVISGTGACPAGPAKSSFTSADRQVFLDFSYTRGNAGDTFLIEWFKPDGTLYLSSNFTQTSTGGSYCYYYYISIAGWPPADTLGNWTAKLAWNGTVIASAPFTIVAASNALITTVAGTIGVFPPSPVPALNAPLGQTIGVTTDTNGNAYFTDPDNEMVLRLNSNGSLTAIAGNGNADFTGDGGLGTAASLDNPAAVAVDASGNVYVADEYNNRVRMITPNGIITTIAGTGDYGFTGDHGPAILAQLNLPAGIAVDSSGNVYVADTFNNRVRKIDTNGNINTIVGNGTAGYNGDGSLGPAAELNNPAGLALDNNGNLFIADFNNNLIRKVNLSTGIISTIAGNGTSTSSGDNGPALGAGLFGPQGVAVDSQGNVYVAESRGNKIRKVTPNGAISTIAGTGVAAFGGDGAVATQANLSFPNGVAVDSNGNVYISDSSNKRIRKVSGNQMSTVAGNGNYQFSGDGGSAQTAQLDLPYGVAVDGSGNVYIADQGNNRIRKVTPQGTNPPLPAAALMAAKMCRQSAPR